MILIASIAYYILSGNGLLMVFPVVTTLISWAGVLLMERTEKKKAVLVAVTLLDLLPLIVLKYVNFFINTVNGIAFAASSWTNADPVIPNIALAVPLGISFYTFSALSYTIDFYNGTAEKEKDYLKLLSYVMFFPAVLSGPIRRYRFDAKGLNEGNKLDYHNLTFGAQRMLWGFFKTFVISERMKIISSRIYDTPGVYGGICAITGTVCYAFELYTNFSGCMDIVLGISQMLGYELPENFNTPFFAKSIQEFWRRWHITLGVWMKEYVFYPVLRTKAFTALNDKCKKKYGSKKGKQIANIPALLILWLTVGLWHGGDWKYVIGSGLLHWLYIVCGQLLTPYTDRLLTFLKIKKDAKWLDVLRVIRTFILVNIGFIFFRAHSLGESIQVFGSMFRIHVPVAEFIEKLGEDGLDWIEVGILLISLVVLTVVSVLQQKGSVREMIDKKSLPIRWIIWFALLFFTLLTGYYGPGYSAAEFIYQGF